MSVETVELIIGNDPFGLIEKDARFARYDARKILRRSGPESHWVPRVANLFESLSNNDLLEHIRQLYVSIADYEVAGFPRDQLLQRLMTDDPDVDDYDLLFTKAPWGNRLSDALYPERFRQDQDGNLWSDFVMSRINRALAGEMTRQERFKDTRGHFKLVTPTDVLDFNPVNNLQETSPTVSVYGNRDDSRNPRGWWTDQRFALRLGNVSRVEIYGREGEVKFFKEALPDEIRLTYRLKYVGSTHQIELDSVGH